MHSLNINICIGYGYLEWGRCHEGIERQWL